MIQSVQQATQAASETVRALRGLTSPFFPSNAFMASARSSNKSPHLSFMLMKDHWFKELYQGLKVAARTESFIKTIEGQVLSLNKLGQWNVSCINVFIPDHSLSSSL
jgi:hypothetical protein